METINHYFVQFLILKDINSSTIVSILLKSVAILFSIWYVKFLWGRRKLYIYSRNVQGPFSPPIIGSAHYFVGNTQDILKSLMLISNDYPGLSRVWHGHRLFYMVGIPQHVEIILNHPKALAKEDWYKFAEVGIGKGLFTAPVSQWKRNRKIISPSFNKKILNNFVETIAEQSNVLTNQLKKYSGKGELDIIHVISKCILDIISETVMGVQINAQTNDSQFSKNVDLAMEITFRRMFVYWYHYDFIFNLTKYAKQLNDALSFINNVTTKIVTEKKICFERKNNKNSFEAPVDEGNKRKAFLDYLMELSTQDGKIFTDTELVDEIKTFLVAGTDTSSGTISFLLIILGMFPDVQQKVYEEIIDVLGHDRNIEAADLFHLKYLDRVIKEGMRIFPMGAIVVRAIKEDIDLKDGNVLPEGSSTVIQILNIHRSEKYWPDPLKFNSDRFLPEEIAKRHPCSFIPFSYGPRNCIGFNFAMMTMKCVLASIVRSYKISTKFKKIEDIELKINLLLKPKDGFLISLDERNVA